MSLLVRAVVVVVLMRVLVVLMSVGTAVAVTWRVIAGATCVTVVLLSSNSGSRRKR